MSTTVIPATLRARMVVSESNAERTRSARKAWAAPVRARASRESGASVVAVSAARWWAVLSQVLGAGRSHRDERALSANTTARNEAAVVGVFPHRKTRARRPPRLEHLGVGARFGAHPLEEIKDQCVDGVGHRRVLV
jgi:hypothetical protein